MNFKRLLGIGALIIVVLILFNNSRRPLVSDIESRFTAWNNEIRQKLRSPVEDPAVGTISLTLETTRPEGGKTQWNLSYPDPGNPANNGELRTRIGRLLELLQEGGIFGLPDASQSNEPAIRLAVQHGEQRLEKFFNTSSIGDNIPAQNLIKLFELYGNDKPSSPQVNPAQL